MGPFGLSRRPLIQEIYRVLPTVCHISLGRHGKCTVLIETDQATTPVYPSLYRRHAPPAYPLPSQAEQIHARRFSCLRIFLLGFGSRRRTFSRLRFPR